MDNLTASPALSVHRVMDALDALRAEQALATPEQVQDQVRAVYAREGLPLAEGELQAAIVRCQAVPATEQVSAAKTSETPTRRVPVLEGLLLGSLLSLMFTFFLTVNHTIKLHLAETQTSQAIFQWETTPNASAFDALTQLPAWRTLQLQGTMREYTNATTLQIEHTPARLVAGLLDQLPAHQRMEVNGRAVSSRDELIPVLNQDDNRVLIRVPR